MSIASPWLIKSTKFNFQACQLDAEQGQVVLKLPEREAGIRIARELEQWQQRYPLEKLDIGDALGKEDKKFVTVWNDVMLPELRLMTQLAGQSDAGIDDLIFETMGKTDDKARRRATIRRYKKSPSLRRKLATVSNEQIHELFLQRYTECVDRLTALVNKFNQRMRALSGENRASREFVADLEEKIVNNLEILRQFSEDAASMSTEEFNEAAERLEIMQRVEIRDYFNEQYGEQHRKMQDILDTQRGEIDELELELKKLLADCLEKLLEGTRQLSVLIKSERRLVALLDKYHRAFEEFQTEIHTIIRELMSQRRAAGGRRRRPRPTDDNDAQDDNSASKLK